MRNKIAVIGLGYVGFPLAIEFSKKYKVVGFDIDKSRIKELEEGEIVLPSTRGGYMSKYVSFLFIFLCCWVGWIE